MVRRVSIKKIKVARQINAGAVPRRDLLYKIFLNKDLAGAAFEGFI
jgi:hypothetical protein